MIKKINITDVFLLVVIVAMIILFQFAQQRFQGREVDQIQVQLTSVNNHFISQEMVNNLLKQNFRRSSKVFVENLDLNRLEEELLRNDMIEDAEVFLDEKAVLHARVQQKTAVARVISQSGSYYIDSKGNKMPLSEEFSAHVPVILGSVSENYRKEMMKLLEVIRRDDFLKTTVTGIQILSDQSVNLSVRDYDYVVEFGKLIDIDKKFENYKAFVHYAQKDTLINHYQKVNLRFTEQVICTK